MQKNENIKKNKTGTYSFENKCKIQKKWRQFVEHEILVGKLPALLLTQVVAVT